LDETIVPHDSGRRPHPNLEIADKEINGWIRRLNEKTANLTLVFDCCHSGTITRDAFTEAGRSVDPDLRPVQEMGIVPPPNPEQDDAAGDRGPSGWLPLFGRYVLIAGCLDAELAHEMEAGTEGATVPHGALTFLLARELAAARPGTTYRDVFERTALGVSTRYRDQHPQLEGEARDRELFGTRMVDVAPFVPITERVDGRVSVGGGAAFGLARGSEWDVYPAGTELPEPGRRLGRVRVEEVHALSSVGTVMEETEPSAVAVGARAIEAVHAFEDQRLGVEVRGPLGGPAQVKELEAGIEASPFLRLAASGTAEIRVYLLGPRAGTSPDEPVPQLPVVAEASWAAVGRDGRLAMPIHAADEPGVVEMIVSNLERITRFRRAVVLGNPDPSAPLRGQVDLVLLVQDPGGTWTEARPAAAGGRIAYTEGQPIAFRITNGHTAPVYVTVLDFGLTGRIAQVHPPAGAADRLDPGMELRVGVEAGRELPLEFPSDFPFVRDPGEADPVDGLETLKLFATTGRPVDFDPLLQEGVRSADDEGSDGSPLGRLLSMALRGQGTRDVNTQPLEAPPDDQWITVDRPFVLRRGRG
jgi:hypothetical protein